MTIELRLQELCCKRAAMTGIRVWGVLQTELFMAG